MENVHNALLRFFDEECVEERKLIPRLFDEIKTLSERERRLWLDVQETASGNEDDLTVAYELHVILKVRQDYIVLNNANL